MKEKKHARELREKAAEQRKQQWQGPKAVSGEAKKPEAAPPVRKPVIRTLPETPAKTPEEETREFLAYLEKEHLRIPDKEDVSGNRGKPRREPFRTLDLENGMPTVEEALGVMRMELQRLKRQGVKVVKLIHGYGSTGRGGKIRIGVRNELARMERGRMIQFFVTGEEFGPFHEKARMIADRFRDITRDTDYGNCNHGITIVLL